MAEEDQAVMLDACMKLVREQAFYMKRAIDENNLKTTIEHAVEMLRVMKHGGLHPKSYYELYMKVIDEMRTLEDYFMSLQKTGTKMVDVYERVQSCTSIIARLYLLCCAGGAYISSMEAPAKEILKDLVEMIKGVQHPMRGLFLRFYLAQVTKNRLPDAGSTFEGEGGNTDDAVNFVLQNFAESNRLWVRLQVQGAKTDKKKREKDRLDLRLLVGTNLVRLSQMEGITIDSYKKNVLPMLLDETINCKDTIAQNYLMDCIIQVFPDEFHLATLDLFLKACTLLKEKVNVRGILESLMTRLSTYALSNKGVVTSSSLTLSSGETVNTFKLFNDCVASLIEERTALSLLETLRMQTILINFSLKCFPARIDYVAHCLSVCNSLIEKSDFLSKNQALASDDDRSTDEATLQIELLLSTPLSALSLRVLEIPAYSTLMGYLPWGNWKELSSSLLRAVLNAHTCLSDAEQVERLLNSVTPLLKDKDGSVTSTDAEGRDIPVTAAFKSEQFLLSRLVHLMENEDTDIQLKLYVLTRKFFLAGGNRRISITLPSLLFAALNLVRKVAKREYAVANEGAENPDLTPPQFSSRKVLQFALELITSLSSVFPEQALHLYLQAAQAADEMTFSAIAYEFVKESLLLYETDVSESKAQVRALTAIIGTLLQCKHFSEEDYGALVTKCAQYANKLLKKTDQSQLVSLCAYLFWPQLQAVDGPERAKDGERVLECLQRSLKIASSSDPNLFVEILDKYIYYFEKENPSIQAGYISSLVALINDQMGGSATAAPTSPPRPAVIAHYKNTIGKLHLFLLVLMSL